MNCAFTHLTSDPPRVMLLTWQQPDSTATALNKFCSICTHMEFTQNLGLTPSNNGDFAQDFFDCSLHKKHREKCGGHFIRVKVLEQLVLKHMQLVVGHILRHEDYFRTVMEQQMKLESAEKLQVIRKQLSRDEKRIAELKRLFIKIY